MDRKKMKLKKKMIRRSTTCNVISGVDRISSLPDDLIHHIFSFSDAKVAVRSSVLSKRWKLIWTTLPFINSIKMYYFFIMSHKDVETEIKFFDNFFTYRNHNADIFSLYLYFQNHSTLSLVDKFIDYAIAHNVQDLTVTIPDHEPGALELSTFRSTSINKLKLILYHRGSIESSDCWHLPALTTLDLHRPSLYTREITLPESYLLSSSSLQTLVLDGFQLPESISLPTLTTLYLKRCPLPLKVWDSPALLTLTFKDVVFPNNTTEFFRALVNLQNLTLFFEFIYITDCFINCPRLVNLHIEAWMRTSHDGKIMVVAPKIHNFTSVGFFRITFGVSELENVNIKLPVGFGCKSMVADEGMKQYYHRVAKMFRGMGSVRILTLDLDTIKALSAVLDFLAKSPPPFYNLNYVKVPQGYKESSMSTYLRYYLLGRSPKATIVTTLPQVNPIPVRETAASTAQNVVLREPLAAPTNLLVDSELINRTTCVDTLDIGVQQEQLVLKSLVSSDRVTQIGAPAEGTGNVRGSSSRRNLNVGLWQGHEVNSEFVSFLDLIINKYPETFEHFTTKNKKVCTMKLNMLCTSVYDFTKISMTDVDTEMIAEYRDVFASLQKFGFNVSWLVSRLDYIEQLRFSQPLFPELREIDSHIDAAKNKLQDLQISIDDIKTKLQDLHSLRSEKMQEIKKAFGTMGTNLVVGYIGDDLLSGP